MKLEPISLSERIRFGLDPDRIYDCLLLLTCEQIITFANACVERARVYAADAAASATDAAAYAAAYAAGASAAAAYAADATASADAADAAAAYAAAAADAATDAAAAYAAAAADAAADAERQKQFDHILELTGWTPRKLASACVSA